MIQLINELKIPSDRIALWFEEGSLGYGNYDTTILTDDPLNPCTLSNVHVKGGEPLRFILEESGEYLVFEEWFCANEYRVDTERTVDVNGYVVFSKADKELGIILASKIEFG